MLTTHLAAAPQTILAQGLRLALITPTGPVETRQLRQLNVVLLHSQFVRLSPRVVHAMRQSPHQACMTLYHQ
jgi:hypothetical protein